MLDRPLPREAPDSPPDHARRHPVHPRRVSPPRGARRRHQRADPHPGSGSVPVVAHPERYSCCTPQAVERWRELGARMQLDATTLFRSSARGQPGCASCWSTGSATSSRATTTATRAPSRRVSSSSRAGRGAAGRPAHGQKPRRDPEGRAARAGAPAPHQAVADPAAPRAARGRRVTPRARGSRAGRARAAWPQASKSLAATRWRPSPRATRRCCAAEARSSSAATAGSAADAQHVAAEYVVRYADDAAAARGRRAHHRHLDPHRRRQRSRLRADLRPPGRGALQAGRPARAAQHQRPEPQHPRRRARRPRARASRTVAFVGADGGDRSPALVDQAIVVPSDVTGRIQVLHLALEHLIVELVEDALLPTA